MPLYLWIAAHMRMIQLHLRKTRPIWVIHKVKSIAPWRFIPHYNISFLVLKHQVYVQQCLAFLVTTSIVPALSNFMYRPFQVLSSCFLREAQGSLIEGSGLGCDEGKTAFFLGSKRPDWGVASDVWWVVEWVCGLLDSVWEKGEQLSGILKR